MSAVNLLPAYRIKASHRRRTHMHWTCAIIGYTAVLVCGCAMFTSFFIVDRSESRALSELEADLASAKDLARNVSATNRGLEARLKAAALAGDHPDWSVVLALLAKSRTDGVKLESIAMTPSAGQSKGVSFRMTGVGVARSDVTGFVSALEDLNLFDSVVAVEIRARDGTSAREYVFELLCDIKGEPVRNAGGAP